MPYSLEYMQIVEPDRKRNTWDPRSQATALLIIAGTLLLLTPSYAVAQSAHAQKACEAKMLGQMDAREVFSGKAYDVLTEVARAYRRPIPRVYTVPGSWNMAYIAGSVAIDGRGKILIGQQAISSSIPSGLRASSDTRWPIWSQTTRRRGATITFFAIHKWNRMPMH